MITLPRYLQQDKGFVVCPICDRNLVRNKMGVHAHLNMHFNKKEITKETAVRIEIELFKRRETILREIEDKYWEPILNINKKKPLTEF